MTESTATQDTHSTQQSDPQNPDKNYDIVLYGATSFVGELTAEYLHRFLNPNYNANDSEVKWAIAGRNEHKLNDVKDAINAPDLPTILADSNDLASLNAMCEQAKVVISTVGPYLKYGENLIQACVNNGTDYVDLTGEAIFIKDMMDKYADDAKASGARIVNSCGFDSIPSDLGVLFTQNYAKDKFGEVFDTIHMRVKASKGGLSGGTIASMATIFEEVGTNKQRRKQLANPYLLVQDSNPPSVRQTSHRTPSYDDTHERWVAPFVMETINTRIVHHTNQLKDYAYGRDFKYDEAMWMPDGMKGRVMSYGMTAGLAGFALGMRFDKTRDLLNDKVLPKPGTGPSKSERDNGYFDIRFFADTVDGEKVQTQVKGDKDPGYGGTCQMLAQSALCLLKDVSKDEVQGGFWTPASAMGEKLIKRLESHAGLTFAVIDG